MRSLNLIADQNEERLLLWFRERYGDAQVIAKNQVTRENLPQLLSLIETLESDGLSDAEYGPIIRGKESFRRIARFLNLIQRAYGKYRTASYQTIRIVSVRSGHVVVSTQDSEVGLIRSDEGSLMGMVRDTEVNVACVVSRDHRSVPNVNIAHTIVDSNGSVIGVVIMEIATEVAFGPFLHSREGLGLTGEALLVDEEGRILTSLRHPLPDGSRAKIMEYIIAAKPAAYAASGHEGTIESDDYRGHRVIAAYRHIPISKELGWGMVVKMDRAELLGPMNDAIAFSIWIGAIGVVFVVIFTSLLTRRLTSPLHQVVLAATRLAAGDRSVRTRLNTEDEVGILSTAFDTMAERIDSTWRHLEARTAELDAVNRELETFAYAVAHDLRAPLRAIDGFSQALVEDYGEGLEGEAKTYLRYVREGSQEMADLIDDLLILSRVTRGEMTCTNVNLSEIAAEVVEILKKSSPERKVIIHLTPWVVVRGDPRLLRGVMENLLGNAWKFTSRREEAQIFFLGEELDGKVRCEVRDNGAGFDMAYQNKLFAPFQRLHSAREFEGTGIGLSTVQRIINRHGGTIRAEGCVGKGATFVFELRAGEKNDG